MAKATADSMIRGLDFGTSFLSAITKGAKKRNISTDALYDKMKDNATIEKILDFLTEKAANIFPIWKTITVDKFKSGLVYKQALTNGGFRVSDWANDLLKQVMGSPTELTLDLVRVTAAELGFKDGATLDKIYARAKELGLELCPAEAGPALRLAYTDQPMNEWIAIAMEPLPYSSGDLKVFNVERYDYGAWLHSYGGRLDGFWYGSSRFVFVRK